MLYRYRLPLRVMLTFCAVPLIQTALAGPLAAGETPPPGFVALFNGEDLGGWRGLVANPKKRAEMSKEQLAAAQRKADERMRAHWKVVDGVLVFDGKGDSLCTSRDYGDFELLVDWKIEEKGDSGIYLRGSPQVQIWDAFNLERGRVGSGGLFNNEKNPSQPLIRSDRPIGEWNSFRIIMVGKRVTIYLNDVLVTDDVVLENYWESGKPIYPTGQIELQNHGNTLYFRKVFIREIPRRAGATRPRKSFLRKGQHVAVVGDSITEQKLYSKYIEDYLLMCLSDLDLRIIQLGWSGERAPGFEARMENDLIPFQPDVVTTCYGMNDGLYRPYEDSIGRTYRTSMRNIVRRLGSEGATVLVGSPGAVDTYTFKRGNLPAGVYNHNLSRLRDIARDIAREEGQVFANVHDPMILAQLRAKPVLGEAYHVCGRDGFHPRPNGQLVMAYAFLKAMGVDGEIGRITIDLKGKPRVSSGHRVVKAYEDGDVLIESRRYPFCFFGDEKSSESTRSILLFLPFNEELNRLILVVKNLPGETAKVSWTNAERAWTREFSRQRLEAGINLAAEFEDNPFRQAFETVDQLIARKQAFETRMIKDVVTRFRTVRGILGDDAEAERALATLRSRLFKKQGDLHKEVRRAIKPLEHWIKIDTE